MSKTVVILIRVGVTLAVSWFSALVTAVALAVVDLYLTGHSLPSLGAPWIESAGGQFSISAEDVILLATVLVVGTATWLITRALQRPRHVGPMEGPS